LGQHLLLLFVKYVKDMSPFVLNRIKSVLEQHEGV